MTGYNTISRVYRKAVESEKLYLALSVDELSEPSALAAADEDTFMSDVELAEAILGPAPWEGEQLDCIGNLMGRQTRFANTLLGNPLPEE